jgi:hypothetical protein
LGANLLPKKSPLQTLASAVSEQPKKVTAQNVANEMANAAVDAVVEADEEAIAPTAMTLQLSAMTRASAKVSAVKTMRPARPAKIQAIAVAIARGNAVSVTSAVTAHKPITQLTPPMVAPILKILAIQKFATSPAQIAHLAVMAVASAAKVDVSAAVNVASVATKAAVKVLPTISQPMHRLRCPLTQKFLPQVFQMQRNPMTTAKRAIRVRQRKESVVHATDTVVIAENVMPTMTTHLKKMQAMTLSTQSPPTQKLHQHLALISSVAMRSQAQRQPPQAKPCQAQLLLRQRLHPLKCLLACPKFKNTNYPSAA